MIDFSLKNRKMLMSKADDDLYFNCSQEHEYDYVAGRYPGYSVQVKAFLKEACNNGVIHYSTHDEVYALIQTALGHPIPVKR